MAETAKALSRLTGPARSWRAFSFPPTWPVGMLPIACEVEAMPHYRLYFLHSDNRISRAIDVECAGDEHAIEQAASFRYVHAIEVWQGTRLVKRIEPQ